MKRNKRSVSTILLVIFLASLVQPSGIARAVSDYDNLLQVTPTLDVYTDGSAKTQKMDLSLTWWAEFKQTYAKRVAQNIGWATNFATEFEDIVESGGSWGVFLRETLEGNIISFVGTRDPNAHCGFIGSASSGSYTCTSSPGHGYVRGWYFTHNSYAGNGCMGSYANRCSDNGMNIYDEPVIVSGPLEYTIFSVPTPNLTSYRFFYMNFDLVYPSNYGGVLIPTHPPAAKYVAAGDSFSTGEGNPAFEAGSAEDGVNECHRSPQAYPRLVQSALNLGPTAFVACSGATTNDVLGIPEGNNPYGKWNEPAQINALSDETEIVTITIGGNDIGFGDFGYECLFPVNLTHGTCDEFTDIYDETVWKITNELPDKVKNVYGALLNEAENADIYVLGYPYIAPYKTIEDVFDQDCGGLYDEFPNNWGDARAAHEVTELLNDTIEDAVNTTNAQYSTNRLKFVPVDEGAFAGHDACSDDSYFHGIVFPDTEYSVHPDRDGQIAYAVDLAGAMS